MGMRGTAPRGVSLHHALQSTDPFFLLGEKHYTMVRHNHSRSRSEIALKVCAYGVLLARFLRGYDLIKFRPMLPTP